MGWKLTIRRITKFAVLGLTNVAASATPAPAAEPQKVGRAEIIRNEVVDASEESQFIPINVGDDVVRDEVIRTSADANARFGLIDNTQLTLGPASTLKIDRAFIGAENVATRLPANSRIAIQQPLDRFAGFIPVSH